MCHGSLALEGPRLQIPGEHCKPSVDSRSRPITLPRRGRRIFPERALTSSPLGLTGSKIEHIPTRYSVQSLRIHLVSCFDFRELTGESRISPQRLAYLHKLPRNLHVRAVLPANGSAVCTTGHARSKQMDWVMFSFTIVGDFDVTLGVQTLAPTWPALDPASVLRSRSGLAESGRVTGPK